MPAILTVKLHGRVLGANPVPKPHDLPLANLVPNSIGPTPVFRSEYLVARRGKHLSLNLIDAVVEVDFPRELFDTALRFLHEGVQSGDPVLIHCNQGVSRSPGIGLLYLHRHTDVLPAGDYEQAARFYEREVYPHFNPGKAIRHFLKSNWASYGPDSA